MIRTHAPRLGGSEILATGLFLAALVAASLLFARPAHADTFTVTSTSDSGQGSLRQAILDANANRGGDTVRFNISGGEGGPVKTIAPTSELPSITGPVVMDGYTQPGSKKNTQPTGGLDSVILVELSGSGAGPSASGLDIRASNTVVRGLAINRFALNGILISRGAQGVRIEGNYIGTDASGTLDRGNEDGVDIFPDTIGTGAGANNTVGGASPAARNLISGNNGNAVVLDGRGRNRVQGNLMGVQKDGSTIMGGSDEGVLVASPGNIVGGAEPGTGNVIAHSFEAGVGVEGTANTGNRILSNSIYANGELGVDLATGGREQDPRDTDTGPNNLQNFPVLTSARRFSSDSTIIKGTLDSTPSTKRKKKIFTVQFFANPQADTTSLDEGKVFLGQKRVTTNRQGKVSFSFQTGEPVVAAGDRVTATATNARGNTSEFSDPTLVSSD